MEQFYYIIPIAFIIYNQYQIQKNLNSYNEMIKNKMYFISGFFLGGLAFCGLDLSKYIKLNDDLTINNSSNNSNNNNSSDSDTESESEENSNNANNANNNVSSNTPSNASPGVSPNTRVYETTFTIPIDQNNLFGEILGNQFSSLLNNSVQRRRNLQRRTRFPTTNPNAASSENNENDNVE